MGEIQRGASMTIKDIRRSLNLTQKEFAEKYHIPLQTIKQWESDPESSSYRRPPDYVFYMLSRLGDIDRIVEYSGSISREENIMRAAERSRDNAKHWLRYLRKEFIGGKSRLTSEQVAVILNSGRLSMYQRISLLRAIEPGTPTNEYVLSLNERAKTPMVDKLLRERGHVG